MQRNNYSEATKKKFLQKFFFWWKRKKFSGGADFRLKGQLTTPLALPAASYPLPAAGIGTHRDESEYERPRDRADVRGSARCGSDRQGGPSRRLERRAGS